MFGNKFQNLEQDTTFCIATLNSIYTGMHLLQEKNRNFILSKLFVSTLM